MVSATKIVNASLRAVLFCFTVISLGIEGHLRASTYNTARVNLGISASVIGLVLSVFVPVVVLFVEQLYNVFILFGLDFISLALYVSASASLTQQRHTCHEPGRGKCSEFKAGFAFLYMDWIIVFFVMILEVFQFFTEGSRTRSKPFDYNTRRPASSYPPPKEQPQGFEDHEASREPSPVSATGHPSDQPAAQA